MIRLLPILFVSSFFLSCEEVYTSEDELFYQISEQDSVRCMEEILDGILEEARVEQEILEEIQMTVIACFPSQRDILRVNVNSAGDVMIQNKIKSTNILEEVYHYFMCNQSLSTQETRAAALNRNHPGYKFPFYNRFRMEEIDKKIRESTKEWEEVKNTKDAEHSFIEYFYLKTEEWKTRKRTLEMIGDSVLVEISPAANLEFKYKKESQKSRKVLKEIAFAFYQMRNYECMRYFGESYLSLYDRFQRNKQPLDKEKLQTLQKLHPARIYIHEWGKPSIYDVPPPQLVTP